MNRNLRTRLLWVAATDSTFERMEQGGRAVLSGRCIHCRRRHVLSPDGEPLSPASLEHIMPRNHGGTNEAANLAIACKSCNAAKGRRLDCRRKGDPDLERVVEQLTARRADRWREPPEGWLLGDPPPEWNDPS
ncbi:MAG: HNH endonuclease [Nannocystaceae bacterium]|nr:HNH endonuclease [bacterium]